MKIEVLQNNSSDRERFYQYLLEVNTDFAIPLSDKVNLQDYAVKLLTYGRVLVAIDSSSVILGAIAYYCNNHQTQKASWPFLSVKSQNRGRGYAAKLINRMLLDCKNNGMKYVQCDSVNPIAVNLYKKMGFREIDKSVVGQLTKVELLYNL